MQINVKAGPVLVTNTVIPQNRRSPGSLMSCMLPGPDAGLN